MNNTVQVKIGDTRRSVLRRPLKFPLASYWERRRQPGRVLLLGLTGTSLLLFLVNQTNLTKPYRPFHSPRPPPYPSRRIQDYQSPEYTSPGIPSTAESSQKDDPYRKENLNPNVENQLGNRDASSDKEILSPPSQREWETGRPEESLMRTEVRKQNKGNSNTEKPSGVQAIDRDTHPQDFKSPASIEENADAELEYVVSEPEYLVAVSENIAAVSENTVAVSENTVAVSENIVVAQEHAVVEPENIVTKPENVDVISKSIVGKPENVDAKPVNDDAKSKNVVSKPVNVVTKPEDVVAKPQKVVAKSQKVVPKPKNIVATPEKVVTKRKNIVTKPKNIVAKPKNIVAKPKNIVAKPKNIVAKPENVVTKPNNIVAKPQNVVAKPEKVVATPENIVAEPENQDPLKPADVSAIMDELDTGDETAGLMTDERRFELESLMPRTTEGRVAEVLRRERRIVQAAMEGYEYHPDLKKRELKDLVLEGGGRPVRSLVITTWRSGSTFIGDVLQSHPASYYHYEPLLDFGINQVRSGDNATQAMHNLKHLLNCDYSDMEHYLQYGSEHPWLFSHNQRLWLYCTMFPDLCWRPEFLSPFCSLFPFQSLKTVRLRLNLTKELLQDKKLDVQVLLLVRDPRGTMQSRHHRDWCPGQPDCDDPAHLCQDLVNDYNTAIQFRRQFPHSFRVVRYEDLSFQAYNMTKELFHFFRLNYHPRVQDFLDTHTKVSIGGVSSTFRDSKTAPIHWQHDLPWEEVERIQKVCSKALRLWGYEIAKDENHLRTFMPVGKFRSV